MTRLTSVPLSAALAGPVAGRMWLPLLGISALFLMLTGCSLLPSRSRVQYVLSLHRIVTQDADAPRGPGVIEVTTPVGKSISVRAAPELSSEYFTHMEILQLPDSPPALKISLNDRGRFRWIQMQHLLLGAQFALLVDQYCHSIVTLRPNATGDDYLILPGPWTTRELEGLVRQCETNYRRLNPR